MFNPLRVFIVGLFTVAAVTQVFRLAIVGVGGGNSSMADRLWPSHPNVLRQQIMSDVAHAAIRASGYAPATDALIHRLAIQEPLAAEPFLVYGSIALQEGEYGRSEQLLRLATMRAPRSVAAHYLLSDLYLRSGRISDAVAEMGVLNRLLPGAMVQLAPALAAYARAPGAFKRLGPVLDGYPEMKPRLLLALAADTRQTELILALAGSGNADEAGVFWREQLVGNLVKEGSYQQAYRVWAKLSNVKQPPGSLFNPTFGASRAPAPFNWELARGSGGVAEARNGGLQVLYFGRATMALAAQTLMLMPGSYQFAMTVSGTAPAPGAISWQMSCLGSGDRILLLPISGKSASKRVQAEIKVPANGCGAQKLELRAEEREFPQRADFYISRLQLARSR